MVYYVVQKIREKDKKNGVDYNNCFSDCYGQKYQKLKIQKIGIPSFRQVRVL